MCSWLCLGQEVLALDLTRGRGIHSILLMQGLATPPYL